MPGAVVTTTTTIVPGAGSAPRLSIGVLRAPCVRLRCRQRPNGGSSNGVHGAHNRNGDTGEGEPAPHCIRRIAPIDGAPICSHGLFREWTGRVDGTRAVMIDRGARVSRAIRRLDR